MILERNSRARAFSLVEIVFSIGLFAIAVITVIGLATTIMQSGQKASDISVGKLAAQRALDQVVPAAIEDPDFWANDYLSSPYAESSVTINRTEFKYKVFAKDLGATSRPNNRMKRVDVLVTWWDSDLQDRLGYGQLSTELTQIVRERTPPP